ncbi:MAG: acetoin utilization protein AcuB [Chloroflexia bacterium]|jgi:CBS domain-containing protein|nr:acetoin utilization protein AcuB [Chloroflexia bacterium]
MVRQQLLVGEWMSSPVEVVTPETPVADAYNTMMQKGIRRLPVVKDGQLVGIVTIGDLREARPSPATSLSIYELNYLLTKLTVGQVMTHDPYRVQTGSSIQDAARIMLRHKIGGLPVVNDQSQVVGVITESDIFRMLIDQWNYLADERINPALVPAVIAAKLVEHAS